MGTEGASMEISKPLLVSKTQQIKPVEEEPEQQIPEWKDQITIRGLAVSALLGTLFCIITHKLNLTVGIILSLNVGVGFNIHSNIFHLVPLALGPTKGQLSSRDARIWVSRDSLFALIAILSLSMSRINVIHTQIHYLGIILKI